MADSASVISSKNSDKSKLTNLINRTTSETLRLNDIEKVVNSPNSLSTNAPRKKTSFQITSVIVGSRASNDGGDDSADDLDESHAEDISEVLDNSRITDLENETPSYSEDTFSKDDVFFNASSSLISAPVIPTSSQYGLAIVATPEHSESALNPSDNCENSDSVEGSGIEVTDSVINLGVVSTKHDPEMRDMHPPAPRTERFKVVKIESTEPFKRGRWVCMDYLDHNIAQKDQVNTKTESSDSAISVTEQSAPAEQPSVINSTEEQPQTTVPSEVVNTPVSNMQSNESSQVTTNQIPNSSAPTVVPTSYPSVSPGQSLQNSMQMAHIINSSAPPPVSQQSQSLSQVHMQQILANSNQHQSLQPQQMQQVIASANVASMPQQQNPVQQPLQQQPVMQQPMQQIHQPSQQFQTQQQQTIPQQQLPQQQPMPQQQNIPQTSIPQQSQQPISQPQQQSMPQQQVVSQQQTLPQQQTIPQQQVIQQQQIPQQQQGIPQQQGIQQSIPQQQAMPQQQYQQMQQQQPMMQQQIPQQPMQNQMPVQQVQMQPNVQQMTMQPQNQPSLQQPQMMQQPMQQMQQQQPTQMHQVPYSQGIPQAQPPIMTQATSQQQVTGMMQQMHPQMQGFQQGQMMPNIQPIMNIQSQPHLQPQYYTSSQQMPTGIVTSQTGLMTQGTVPQVSMPGTTSNLPPLQTYASVTSMPTMQVPNMPQTPPIPTAVQYSMPHIPQTNQMAMPPMSMPQNIMPQPTQLPPQQPPPPQQGQSYAGISSPAQSYTHGISSSSVPSAIMMEHPIMNGEHIENPTAALIESLNEVTSAAEEIQTGEDAESTTGANAVAIDNKIEQAMDLVKSHLMFAVREEVEVLKEKINELMERIGQLESENATLRAAASSETLALLTQTSQNTTTNNP